MYVLLIYIIKMFYYENSMSYLVEKSIYEKYVEYL